MAARLLLHEVFHNSGLWQHPYQIDACDDTPTLPNCWGYNGSIETWALSPCQICRLHEYAPLVLIQDENEGECAPLSAFFDLPSEACGPYDQIQVWMQGSASYNESDHFIEIYQTPSVGSNIVSGNYKSQWFGGPAEWVNLGPYMNYSFGCNKIYRVKLAVSNSCGDWDEMVRYVTVKCLCDELTGSEEVESLSVSPNPASGSISINYELSAAQNLTLLVYDVFGGQLVGTLKQQEWASTDPETYLWNVGSLPNGWYFVRAITNNQVKTAQFSVQH
jgi:hypothetical protein